MSMLSDQNTEWIVSFLLYFLKVCATIWAICIHCFHFAVCLGMITNILDAVGFLYILEILPIIGGAHIHPHGRSHIVFMHCTEVFLNLWKSTLNNQTGEFKKHVKSNTKEVNVKIIYWVVLIWKYWRIFYISVTTFKYFMMQVC